MTNEMNQLVIYRGRLKGSLTRLLSFADAPPDDCTFEIVISRLERLEEVWQGFIKSTDELHQFEDQENFVDPEMDFEVYDEKYLVIREKLYALRSKYAPKPAEKDTNREAFERLAEQQAAFLQKISTTTTQKENELPRISIPAFTGFYRDWPSFKDLFESTVDSKVTLTDTQKFHYFKSLLEGDAARLIQHMPVTKAAYKTAWIRLNDRYDRPKHIVGSFIDAFMALPSTSMENGITLRKISDEANEIIRGLDAVGKNERDWWLIHLLLAKIDTESKSRWIHDSRDNPCPTIADFLDFLDIRCEELELCQRKATSQIKQGNSKTFNGKNTKCLVSTNGKSNSCIKCKSAEHTILKCPLFLQLDLNERRNFVKQASLCYNCLRPGHSVMNCSSKHKCKDCQRRHHSLLHISNTTGATTTYGDMQPAQTSASSSTAAAPWSTIANVACPASKPSVTQNFQGPTRKNIKEFIMPTALINVKTRSGKLLACRALLDSASTLSYITESCAQRLGHARSPSKILVSGISSVKAETTRGFFHILVQSRVSETNIDAVVHVLPRITTSLPNQSFSNQSAEYLKDLPLADPFYNVPSQIDILLGLEHIWNILTYDRRYDSQGNTIAISTIFGWVVTCVEPLPSSDRTTSLVSTVDIDRCLRSFWEIEEPEHKTKLDPDDAYVESHFKSTHSRSTDGKYVVQLPFKIEDPRFGNTFCGALSRFYAVERRLQRNAVLREQYNNFMREYENLGHMRNISSKDINVTDGRVFYLPHHPMGILSPIIVRFKILLREIWTLNLAWDEPLPENLATLWSQYREDLHVLENFKMPRFAQNDFSNLEFHGFSDASMQAYSATVYLRFIDSSGASHVTLISSKTRVAPLKQKSLPKLELCGALLLSRLLKRIFDALPHESIKIRAWCDSTIVLSWLSQPPLKLKVFEANRTSEILDNLPRRFWDHVSSKENPADCASRGMSASQLLKHKLWWSGPIWLSDTSKYNSIINRSNNFNINTCHEALEALKLSVSAMVITVEDYNPLEFLITRISKWRKLVRIVAYMFTFFFATKHRKTTNVLCPCFDDLQRAELVLLKYAQNVFKDDRAYLQKKGVSSAQSRLLKLHPFVDAHGVLRVGGRLRNSQLDAAAQNPIILPKSSRITQLILEDLHERILHPGVSALFVIARQRYWILGARNLIRKLTHNCLRCFRHRRHTTQQIMANLPSVRVRQAFPFENTGCDYAGPLTLKQFSGRNARQSKGYICLFVCLATSAIHLELATDLSTECFIAALRRFIARRGKCRQIYSDNGRNFLGASRELTEMHKVILSQAHNKIVFESLAEDGIQWKFIPPQAPHWGGVWESAVRSVKLHLRRVIMNTILTFEQMHTLLTQIEAVVNSRPLCTAPDSEYGYLSPAHFLIGRTYTSVPEGELADVVPNKLGYWQHVQNMYQGFWQRWHKEYLTSLQQRAKWQQPKPNLVEGNLVIVKERNLPPAKWLMGKVIEAYPGTDGKVRVVKLKMHHGEMTRPITGIVKLPLC